MSRNKLIIDDYRKQIVEGIKNNRVILVRGQTGCGKSTKIPQYILEDIIKSENVYIEVLLPRVIATSSLAEYMFDKVEDGVSCHCSSKQISNGRSKLSYMTIGYYMHKFAGEMKRNIARYIIVDDVNERSLDTDILLGKMLAYLKQNNKLKLLIMSALFNVEAMQNFFKEFQPIFIDIPRKPSNIEVRFKSCKDENEAKNVVNQILDITHEEFTKQQINDAKKWKPKKISPLVKRCSSHILVFLSSEFKVLDIENMLEKAIDYECEHRADQEYLKFIQNIEIHPVFSNMLAKEKEKLFKSQSNQKVIISTNVLENGLTIPDLKYVIDSGKASRFGYINMDNGVLIKTEPISIAEAEQRKGLLIRNNGGLCVRMYENPFSLIFPIMMKEKIKEMDKYLNTEVSGDTRSIEVEESIENVESSENREEYDSDEGSYVASEDSDEGSYVTSEDSDEPGYINMAKKTTEIWLILKNLLSDKSFSDIFYKDLHNYFEKYIDENIIESKEIYNDELEQLVEVLNFIYPNVKLDNYQSIIKFVVHEIINSKAEYVVDKKKKTVIRVLPPPQVPHCNYIDMIVKLVKLEENDIFNFPFLEKPNQEELKMAADRLIDLSIIELNNDKYDLTDISRHFVDFPFDTRMAKVVYMASRTYFNDDKQLFDEVVCISVLSRMRTLYRGEKSEQFDDERGDLFKYINAWNTFVNEGYDQNGLNHSNLLYAEGKINNLKNKKFGDSNSMFIEEPDILNQLGLLFLSGYGHNVAIKSKECIYCANGDIPDVCRCIYRVLYSGCEAKIDKKSCVVKAVTRNNQYNTILFLSMRFSHKATVYKYRLENILPLEHDFKEKYPYQEFGVNSEIWNRQTSIPSSSSDDGSYD